MVEFEKYLVEVQDFRKPTDPYRGIYKIYLQFFFYKYTGKFTTCNRSSVGLANIIGILTDNAQKSIGHCLHPGDANGGMELCEVPTIDASP